MSITDFTYFIKAKSDELAVLGAPMDADDLIERILDDLDEDNTELVRAVQARESTISFDELHEKLLLFEATLQTRSHSSRLGPVTANSMTRNSTNNTWRQSRPNWRSPTNGNYSRSPAINNNRPVMYPTQTRHTRPPARPYLGHCQICGTQGHTAKRCPSFNLVPVQSSNNANSPLGMNPTWQPQAHYTSLSPSANTS